MRTLIRFWVIVGSTEMAVLVVYAVWSEFPLFEQVVLILRSIEQAALGLCSLVEISKIVQVLAKYSYCWEYRKGCAYFMQSSPNFPSLRGCSNCRECWADCASHVLSDQGIFVVDSKCSFDVEQCWIELADLKLEVTLQGLAPFYLIWNADTFARTYRLANIHSHLR